MALPVVLKEPEVIAPTGPSAEDMLSHEREERRQLETRFAAAEADARARFDMIERRGYAQAMPAAQAQEELGLTSEDIAANPEKALSMLKEHISRETEARLEKKYSGVISGLAEQVSGSQVEALRSKKYAADLIPLVEEYFQHNPQDRHIPGKATEVYERLVGKNLDALEKRESTRGAMDKGYSNPNRVEEPSFRSAGALRVEGGGEDDENAQLTEAEEETRKQYNAYGANISKKEWVGISSGKVFPKNRASDWQPEAISKGSTIARMRRVSNVE